MTKQELESKMLDLYDKALEAKEFTVAINALIILSKGIEPSKVVS